MRSLIVVLLATILIGTIDATCTTKKPATKSAVQTCTKDYEEYSECGNDPCQNTCEEPERSDSCSSIPKCYPGCICMHGFLRNAKGACVPVKDCYKCRENEVFSQCDKKCENSCFNPDLNSVCEDIACIFGCICKTGYIRDERNGQCILKSDCPPCKGVQVYSECDAHPCLNTCEFPNLIDDCIFEPGCYPGCICPDGYLRSQAGSCVFSDDCVVIKCTRENEEYQSCGSACPKTCANLVDNITCPDLCEKGCFCKEGYVRNDDGDCVLPSECPCEDPNAERVKNPNPCPGGTCDTPKFWACPLTARGWGCQCKKGYVKDANKKCILLSKCPKLKCKENQRVNQCPGYCPPEMTCDRFITGLNPPCPRMPEGWLCSRRCECITGYVRKESGGECVKQETCCEDPNAEVVNCPYPCGGGTCDSPIIPACKKCSVKRGCQCKKGFVKDSNGKCILLSKCPKKVCKKNEVLNPCRYSCTPVETCESYLSGVVVSCLPAPGEVCYPECDCAPGFVRKVLGGSCIKQETCCEDPNAEVVNCPYPCGGGTCDSPRIPACKKCSVLKGCQCKKGFVKDSNGKCILLSKCPKKVCNKNEVLNPCRYSCPPVETCDSYLSGAEVDCVREPGELCYPECECSPGFVRKTPEGPCIKQETCCEDPNAEVVSCPNPCGGGTCENPEFSKNCRAKCKIRGCQCKKGYVLDVNGRCILLSKCPKKKCRKNEFFDTCGTVCPPTCANRNPICTKQCGPGCYCKEGFILNKDKGECIPIEDCPQPTCKGQNEEYNECGSACPRTCENKDDETIICTAQCVPGCFCKAGYVLKDGVCVLPEECDSECGCDDEE